MPGAVFGPVRALVPLRASASARASLSACVLSSVCVSASVRVRRPSRLPAGVVLFVCLIDVLPVRPAVFCFVKGRLETCF